RPVEHASVLEQAVPGDAGREGDVVLLAQHVGEAQVEEFDRVVLDQLEYAFGHGGSVDGGWRDATPTQAGCQPARARMAGCTRTLPRARVQLPAGHAPEWCTRVPAACAPCAEWRRQVRCRAGM